MSLPKYPMYRCSGIDWLGDIPHHWSVSPLKRGFTVTLGKMLQTESSSTDDELAPYVRAANIQWHGIDTTDMKEMWVSSRDREQLKLRLGDLLVSEGGDVGRSCLWGNELDACYFQNSVNRVRAQNGCSNRYLWYWMSTIKDKGYIDVLCNKSTIAHFTAEKVASVPVPFPPLDEQATIAAFLDCQTGKIDELVSEQQRLIELLTEKRQAVISRAVTKGLDPHAPMKHSGIEWLGHVPGHWNLLRLRHACSHIFLGLTSKVDYVEEGGVPLVRLSNIEGGVLNLADVRFISEVQHKSLTKRNRAIRGDVLLGKSGAVIGTTAIIDTDVEFSIYESLFALRPHKELLSPAYLVQLLRSPCCANQMWASSVGMGVGHLNMSDIVNVVVALPPTDEQNDISSFLADKIVEFEGLTRETERAIQLLQEHRTALISAAVTGKIDVRGLVDEGAA